MNYEEARVYLDETSKYGSVLGLENMKALLDRLDNPQDPGKFEIYSHFRNKWQGNGAGISVHDFAQSRVSDRAIYISHTVFLSRENSGE